MAPVVILYWSWRRGGGARFDAWCELAIVVTYVVQLLGLAVGLIAAWDYADPFAHIAEFAGLVGIIVVAEYVGHAAAAALALRVWRRPDTNRAIACR